MVSPSFSDLLKEARSRLQALDSQMVERRKKEDLGKWVEEIQRSVAEIGTRVTTLATQVEGLGKEAQSMRKSQEIPADLRARLEKYDAAIADLSRRVGGEKDTFVAYRQSVRQLVQATAAIKPGDVEGLRKVVEEHLSQYPEREARVKGIEVRLESLQTLQARLQDLEAAVRKSVEGFEDKLKAVGKVGEELEHMKAGVVKEVGASGARVEHLREQAERIEARVREVPALVKKEVDGALVGALGEMWTKLKALEGEVVKAREFAGAAVARPAEALQALEKEVYGLQAKVRATEEVFQAVRGDTVKVKDDAADLKFEVKALRDTPARLKELETRSEGLQALLAQARQEAQEVRTDLKALRDLPARLREVEALRGELAGAKEETEELRGGLAALRDLPGQFKELDAFRGELARMTEETEDLKTDLAALRELPARLREVEALRAEVARMGEDAGNVKADVKDLRDLPGRIKELQERFESAPRVRALEARFAPLETAAHRLEERLMDWSSRFPEVEAKLKMVDANLKEQRETAERTRILASRVEGLEKSVVSLSQRAPAGPTVEDLRRQRQSVMALLDTLRSGYEQKLLAREEYDAIARENRAKIAELDSRIAEMGKA